MDFILRSVDPKGGILLNDVGSESLTTTARDEILCKELYDYPRIMSSLASP